MMGLGYWGNGGSSSSSSNLSALAPPFTVDRSNSKPSSNPLVNFSQPPYVPSFNSSFPSWQYSHSQASGPNFFPNPEPEAHAIDTPPLPSSADYPFLVHQSINSSSPHWPPLEPKSESDAVSYIQYPGDISPDHYESKPYYPSYASPIVDNDSPLVSANEPSYDLLSTSHVGTLHGSSAQMDYTQSLSGLEYVPKWGGYWNGLADGEQIKHTEFDGGFSSEQMDVAGSCVYKNYLNQGGHIADSLSSCEMDSAISYGKSINPFTGVSSSTAVLDNKSCLGQNSRFIPVESSRTPLFENTSSLLVSQPLASAVEPATNSWNHQNQYNPSYGNCFQPLDSCINDCISVTRSSPALVIKPPATNIDVSPQNSVPLQTRNVFSNVASGIRVGSDGKYKSKKKEPYSEGKERFSDGNMLNFPLQKNFPISSHSTKKVELPKKLVTDSLDDTIKARSGFQIPDINAAYDPEELYPPLKSEGQEICLDGNRFNFPLERNELFPSLSARKLELPRNLVSKALDDGFKPRSGIQIPERSAADAFKVAVDSAKVANSAEQLSDSSDNHNPAVDSPCWKGASAFNFSSFEVPTVENLQHMMKTSEASYDANVKGIQKLYNNSLCPENGCPDNGLSLSPNRHPNANCTTNEHLSNDGAGVELRSLKVSSNGKFQGLSATLNPKTEDDLPHDSKSYHDLKLLLPKQPSLEQCDLTKKLNFKSQCAAADLKMNTSDASSDGCLSIHSKNKVSCSSFDEDTIKVANMHGVESAPKINAQMLIKTMNNLSELLLCHCSTDAFALSEQDHIDLKCAINNLDACSKKMVQVTGNQGSLLHQQATFSNLGALPDAGEGPSAGRPNIMREEAPGAHCQVVPEEKQSDNDFDKQVEKFWKFLSLSDDVDIVKDDDVKVIKEVLAGKFHGDEDVRSQAFLYKNLWLEAEAALCSLRYRARFERMKIEMEKCKSRKDKGVSEEDTSHVKKLPGIEVPPSDANVTYELAPVAAEYSPILDTSSTESSPVSSTTGHVNDAEASVMARFHILQSRGGNSNSTSTEGNQHHEAVDGGCENKRINWPYAAAGKQSEAGSMGVALDPHMQHHTSNGSGGPDTDVSEDSGPSEKLPGIDGPPDANLAYKLTPEAEDSSILETSTQNSPIICPTSHVNDVDASVMARFHILKNRGDSSSNTKSMEEGKQKLESVDVGFENKGNNGSFVGNLPEAGSIGWAFGPYLQHHSSNRTIDKFGPFVVAPRFDGVEPSYASLGDNAGAAQSSRHNRLENRLPHLPFHSSLGDAQTSRHNGLENQIPRFEDVKYLGDNVGVQSSRHYRLENQLPCFEDVKPFHASLSDNVCTQSFRPQLPRFEDVKPFHGNLGGDNVGSQSFFGRNRLENQLPLGSIDSSSSDWEHVLKEEILWQN